MFTHLFKQFSLIFALALTAWSTNAAGLKYEVYNPGDKSLFQVSSEIIYGDKEAVLVDAQFQRNDAQELVKRVKATGKQLTTVFISHSDPDYYFGLDVIKQAFPQVKILATQPTVEAIKATYKGKVDYWSPIMKENAPESIVIPEVLHSDKFSVDGYDIEVKGLKGSDPSRTYLWIPELQAVMGGIAVSGPMHLWMADSQSLTSRQAWLATLADIMALKPKVVVPGHFLPQTKLDISTTIFTRDYVMAFNAELSKAKQPADLIKAMEKEYPELKDRSSLEFSAKVLMGEIKWPQ